MLETRMRITIIIEHRMQVICGAPSFIRRARGFVPEPIDLGIDGPSVIATGADLKNTICVTRGREAFLSQHERT